MLTTVLLLLNKCRLYPEGSDVCTFQDGGHARVINDGMWCTRRGAGPVSIDFFYSRARVGARGVAVP